MQRGDGESHRTRQRDPLSCVFLEETARALETGRYGLNLDSSLNNGHLWVSYFTSLFCSKKVIIVPTLVGFLPGLSHHLRESVKSKESVPGGSSLSFLAFLSFFSPFSHSSFQFTLQPYMESLLCPWLLESAGKTNRKRHSSYPQASHSV